MIVRSTSRTEPEAFFLDLFFNAHPTPDGKQKQKAANALVPSVIAYAGGQMDFTVDMGTEVYVIICHLFMSLTYFVVRDTIDDSQRSV